MSIPRERAEAVALRALAWLAGQDELWQTFLNASGSSAGDVRARAGEPEFLGAVLDFLLMNDAWVIGFCAAESLPNDMPMAARAALPGGDMMHWT